jgi:UDP:flavonoid glycosyltransferase YjiC (YdhE family)
VIKDFILSSLEDSYDDTFKAASEMNCDLIISHGLSYGSVLVAEKLKIPWIFTALQPIIMLSADDVSVPPEMPWVINLRKLGTNFYRHLMDLGTARFAEWAEPIYSLRYKLKLTTDIPNPVLGGHFSPHLNLALFSKYFAPAAKDWPAHTVQTGFPFYDNVDLGQPGMSDELHKFLESGDPPIIFTLGSAAVMDAQDFYSESLEAARLLGKRCVLLTGHKSGNADNLKLDNDCIAVDYAPYTQILPRGCVTVHQGGIGTTSQALRSGKPMVIMPYGHDQPDNAARCVRLEVAKMIERRNYCASTSANTISQLLQNDRIKAKVRLIGEKISSENGPIDAADAIESILG